MNGERRGHWRRLPSGREIWIQPIMPTAPGPEEESNWEERHPIAARFLDDAHVIIEGWDDTETDYLLDRLAGHIEFVAAAPEGAWKDMAEHQAASTADDYLELVGWVADINELGRTKKKDRDKVLRRQVKRQEERMERRLAKAEERHEVWKAGDLVPLVYGPRAIGLAQ